MNDIFRKIESCLSMTAIERMAEKAMPLATDADKETLNRILDTRSLDEVNALCAEALGEPERANSIRAERAQRLAKTAPLDPELHRLLGLTAN